VHPERSVMSLSSNDLDRICSPSFLDGASGASMAQLRALRQECSRAELVVSYLRRVVQASIDLVEAEMALRKGAGDAGVSRLIDELPSILSSVGSSHEPVRTSVPSLEPSVGDLDLNAELALEELFASRSPGGENGQPEPAFLPGANVCSLDDEELLAALERLRERESELSGRRHALHAQIDQIQAVIVDRYKSGSADADSLLA
jgi:hypothetical protein